MDMRVLAFVLAGGKGTRLYPLTKERAKPAVPFGGRYRCGGARSRHGQSALAAAGRRAADSQLLGCHLGTDA